MGVELNTIEPSAIKKARRSFQSRELIWTRFWRLFLIRVDFREGMVDLLFFFGLLFLWLKDVSIGILLEEKLILERSGDLQTPIPVRGKLFLFSESGTSFCTTRSFVGTSGTGSFCASGLSVGSSAAS